MQYEFTWTKKLLRGRKLSQLVADVEAAFARAARAAQSAGIDIASEKGREILQDEPGRVVYVFPWDADRGLAVQLVSEASKVLPYRLRAASKSLVASFEGGILR